MVFYIYNEMLFALIYIEQNQCFIYDYVIEEKYFQGGQLLSDTCTGLTGWLALELSK